MSTLETIPVTTPHSERMRRLGRSRGGRVVGAIAALGLVGGMTTACGTLGCKLTAGRTDKENEITLSLTGDHKKIGYPNLR